MQKWFTLHIPLNFKPWITGRLGLKEWPACKYMCLYHVSLFWEGRKWLGTGRQTRQIITQVRRWRKRNCLCTWIVYRSQCIYVCIYIQMCVYIVNIHIDRSNSVYMYVQCRCVALSIYLGVCMHVYLGLCIGVCVQLYVYIGVSIFGFVYGHVM